MPIDGLIAACPKCGLPARPDSMCPHCLLLDPDTIDGELVWRRLKDVDAYYLCGIIHGYVGRWRHDDAQKGMWYVRIEDRQFFLQAELSDHEAISTVEIAIANLLRKTARILGTEIGTPGLSIDCYG